MSKLTLTTALICIILASCHTPRYVYSPAPPNNPFFEKKGDMKLSGYYSGGGRTKEATGINEGYDIQGAYAIGKNWALTAGFFKRRERDTYNLFTENRYNIFDSSVVNYQRKLFEFGGGYFAPLNNAKTIFFNFYGGIAFGKFSFNDNGMDTGVVYSRFHESRIFKWYVQPGMYFITGDYFRFSFLARISSVHYSDISTNYNTDEIDYFKLNRINNRWLGFFEPTLNFQFGVPKVNWVKLDMGLTMSTDPLPNYLEARSICPYIGLSFDFSKMKK